MISKLLITFEIIGLVGLRRRIFDDVEVQDLKSVIELYEALEMVLVGVGGDEPCDALPFLRDPDLIQDFDFPVI